MAHLGGVTHVREACRRTPYTAPWHEGSASRGHFGKGGPI